MNNETIEAGLKRRVNREGLHLLESAGVPAEHHASAIKILGEVARGEFVPRAKPPTYGYRTHAVLLVVNHYPHKPSEVVAEMIKTLNHGTSPFKPLGSETGEDLEHKAFVVWALLTGHGNTASPFKRAGFARRLDNLREVLEPEIKDNDTSRKLLVKVAAELLRDGKSLSTEDEAKRFIERTKREISGG